MCELVTVSHAGYYRHLAEKAPAEEERAVRAAIQEIFLQHRRRYGRRRITAELRHRGMVVNHKRVGRLMREAGSPLGAAGHSAPAICGDHRLPTRIGGLSERGRAHAADGHQPTLGGRHHIAGAVGLGAALDYLDEVGIENVTRYEQDLLTYATAALIAVPGLRLIGTAREKAGVLSFVLDEFRTEDVGVALNREGIAVRAGHHCAQPILRRFGVESTVRPSLALYNTIEDIDALVAPILRMQARRRHGKL